MPSIGDYLVTAGNNLRCVCQTKQNLVNKTFIIDVYKIDLYMYISLFFLFSISFFLIALSLSLPSPTLSVSVSHYICSLN